MLAKMRRQSEDSMRKETCDGSLSDVHTENPMIKQEGHDDFADGHGEALCSDRTELMERIKRGESPTWVPNQAVSGNSIGQPLHYSPNQTQSQSYMSPLSIEQ